MMKRRGKFIWGRSSPCNLVPGGACVTPEKVLSPGISVRRIQEGPVKKTLSLSVLCGSLLLPAAYHAVSAAPENPPALPETAEVLFAALPAEPDLLLELSLSVLDRGKEGALHLSPELAKNLPLASGLLEIRDKAQANGMPLDIRKILLGSVSGGNFVLLEGTFTQAHAQYISRYLFPGRFAMESVSRHGRQALLVEDRRGILQEKGTRMVLEFPGPGLTLISSEDSLEKPGQDDEKGEKDPHWSENFQGLPADFPLKLHVKALESPIAVRTQLREVNAALRIDPKDHMFHGLFQMIPLSPGQTGALAREISAFLHETYADAAKQGDIPRDLLNAFAIRTDREHSVTLEMHLKEEYALAFLQMFLEGLQKAGGS